MSSCSSKLTVKTISHNHTVSQITDFSAGVNNVLNSTVLHSNSANWQSTFQTVSSLSALWGNGGGDSSIVQNNSACWNKGCDVYSSFGGVSASNANITVVVQSNSALWATDANNGDVNVNNFVYNNSAVLLDVDTVVQSNSAQWAIDTTGDLTIIQTTSANWDSNYSTYNTTSASFADTRSTVNSNSAQWIIDTNDGDVNVNTFVYNNSASIIDVDTVVQSNSAQWAIDTTANLILLQSTSANWDSNYSSYNSLSSNYANRGDYLPLSGGTVYGVLCTLSSAYFQNSIIIDDRLYIGTRNTPENIAFGFQALSSMPFGYTGIAIGYNAMAQSNIPDSSSDAGIAIGTAALAYQINGSDNIAIGTQALLGNLFYPSVFRSIAIGKSAGGQSIQSATGEGNITIGYDSFFNNSSGGGNIIIGNSAATLASFPEIANDCIVIGHNAGLTNNDTNAIVIGNLANTRGSNQTVIGNSNTVSSVLFGMISASSGGNSVQWTNTFNTVQTNSASWGGGSSTDLTLVAATSAN